MGIQQLSSNQFPPTSGPGVLQNLTSVRSQVQRQRLFLNLNQQKRGAGPPLQFDPTLTDQRKRNNFQGFGGAAAGSISNGQINQNASNDSRVNSGSSNGRQMQVISKKFINFGQPAGGSSQPPTNQPTSRANVNQIYGQNPSLQKRSLVSKVPPQKMSGFTIDQNSPRYAQSADSQQNLSARSNQGLIQTATQSQRKIGPYIQNSNQYASLIQQNGVQHKAQHHLNFRRQQVMDITDDANTNSYNKLATINVSDNEGTGGVSMEQLPRHSNNNNDVNQPHSQPPQPTYNLFYHQQESSRFETKKSLRNFVKQSSKKELGATSFNKGPPSQEHLPSTSVQPNQLFQFTKKQTLIGDSSLSSTREKATINPNQLFKIKKTSQNNLNQPSTNQESNTQIPQIGKRKPLIIRKNNFISNQNAAAYHSQLTGNQMGYLPESNNTTQTHLNMNTILSSGVTNRFNNTNNNLNLTGGPGNMSEASQSQTRYGITQLLKSLNSTTQSNELINTISQTNIQNSSNNTAAAKDNKLFKINNSKKKLDTARKSRIQQIQNHDTISNNTANILNQNSHSQQPPQIRQTNQPPILSFLANKKRSLLIPKVKVDNTQTGSAQQFAPSITSNQAKRTTAALSTQVAMNQSYHTNTTNGLGSSNNFNQTQLLTSNFDQSAAPQPFSATQVIPNLSEINGIANQLGYNATQVIPSSLNKSGAHSAKRSTDDALRKDEFSDAVNPSSQMNNQSSQVATLLQDQDLQPQKFIKRGQILRMQRQKQAAATGVQSNASENGSSSKYRDSSQVNSGGPHSKMVLQTGDSKNKEQLDLNATAPLILNNQQNSQINQQAAKPHSNSLTRVESKKDLNNIEERKQLKAQHQVQEEFIIHENINDSSCTPNDFNFLNKSSAEGAAPLSSLNQKHGMLIQNQQQQIATSETLNMDAIKLEEASKLGNMHNQLQNAQTICPNTNTIKQEDQFVSSSHPKENSHTPKTIQKETITPEKLKQSQQTEPQKSNQGKLALQHKQLALDKSPNQSQKTEQRPVLKQRLNNISQNTVKSPIGTSQSVKSQNSQQAGPNHEEIVKFPMKAAKVLKLFMNKLTDYERGEILDYPEIYFLGIGANKVQGSPSNEHNYGYDDEKGDYKIVMGDHIGFRYEIISFIGKGSFGTALKCFDHKKKEEVAVKIVKNKKKYQYQAGIELKILNFLKENDQDDIMNVIHMKDYVIFRKHLCVSFELLSMNLFEFLKINDFNGFDHNLIRRFAIQLLYALKYLKEFEIIHCDLKPENILLKEPNKSGIKIIDFGSSTFINERVYTYIQSRFYRAPEIMLGIPYTCAIDMWSFGCIMAELYIGYPIFPGESENDQMSRIIEMCNIPSREVYEISQRRQKFFNETSSGDYIPIMLPNSRGKLRKPGGKPLSLLIGDEDPDFLDFVERCLDWNPETRLSPDDALRHIWVLKGLPPQVLIHHQRMHNITTPELPEPVREARDKFFLEATIQQENSHQSQIGQRSSQQSKERSSVIHNQHSHQPSTSTKTGKSSNQQKTETIKSLERAQLKNQLHQLNHNKLVAQHQQPANHFSQPRNNNVVIHSKITQGGAHQHSNDNSLNRANGFNTIESQGGTQKKVVTRGGRNYVSAHSKQ